MATAMTAPGSGDNLPSKSGGAGSSSKGGGFFTVYKKGQGYWTRMLTALTAGMILLTVAHFVYQQTRPRFAASFITGRTQEAAADLGRNIALGIAAAIVLIGAGIVWKIMNSPTGAEFLITTDSEMKRVNWASRKEVFGSTRVVVIFLFFVCTFLFFSDLLFAYLFYWFGVLKFKPF